MSKDIDATAPMTGPAAGALKRATDFSQFTLVFDGSLRSIRRNIFKIETPFGYASGAAVGNLIADASQSEETRVVLLEALKYARRFLNSKDHDTAFVDAAIAKATGAA